MKNHILTRSFQGMFQSWWTTQPFSNVWSRTRATELWVSLALSRRLLNFFSLLLPAKFHYLYSKCSDQLRELWSPNKSKYIYLTSTWCRSRACLFHPSEFKLKLCKSKKIRIMRKSLQILDKLMYRSEALTTDCRDLFRFLLLFVQVERASRWWYWEKSINLC